VGAGCRLGSGTKVWLWVVLPTTQVPLTGRVLGGYYSQDLTATTEAYSPVTPCTTHKLRLTGGRVGRQETTSRCSSSTPGGQRDRPILAFATIA
jgi:hypothetical protein